MANFYSDQITNFRTVPKVMLKPAELQGRVRIAYFSYVTPATGPAVADFVALTKVPANSRVIDVTLVWQALSTGVGVAGADIGPANDDQGNGFAASFVAALNMDAAGSQRLVPIIDGLPNKTLYTVEKYILAKVTGEAWGGNANIQGWLSYVLD